MADELIVDPSAAAPAPAPDPAAAPSPDPVAAPAPAETDWRTPLVTTLAKDYGGDEKVQTYLSRFKTVDDLAKKVLEQDKLIASGAHKNKAPPGKDAAPEVLAEYRKANGIPETPDAYDLTLDNGIVFGDEDASSLEFIKGVSHELGLNNDQVKGVAAQWHAFKESEIEARETADEQFHVDQSAELAKMWGGEKEIKVNSSRIEQVLKALDGGEEIYDLLMAGRDADGNLIANSAKILNALHELAFRELPNHTLVESSGYSGKSINDRIAEIEKAMGGKGYTNAMAEEYTKLISKRDGKPLR